jgi:hypothetical protein
MSRQDNRGGAIRASVAYSEVSDGDDGDLFDDSDCVSPMMIIYGKSNVMKCPCAEHLSLRLGRGRF